MIWWGWAVLAFIAGATLGVLLMAALAMGSQADDDMHACMCNECGSGDAQSD